MVATLTTLVLAVVELRSSRQFCSRPLWLGCIRTNWSAVEAVANVCTAGSAIRTTSGAALAAGMASAPVRIMATIAAILIPRSISPPVRVPVRRRFPVSNGRRDADRTQVAQRARLFADSRRNVAGELEVLDGDQVHFLGGAGDVLGMDHADAPGVDLVLDHGGFQGGVILGTDGVGECAIRDGHGLARFDHVYLVLGLALEVFLVEAVADGRVGFHDDAGLCAAYAGLPGAGGVGELAGLVVEGSGGLAEVPDVAVLVLGVPVVGVLVELAVAEHGVVHDHRRDAQDRFGVTGDLGKVAFGSVLGVAVVGGARAGREREVRVVDLRGGGIVLRSHVDGVAGAALRRQLGGGRGGCRAGGRLRTGGGAGGRATTRGEQH